MDPSKKNSPLPVAELTPTSTVISNSVTNSEPATAQETTDTAGHTPAPFLASQMQSAQNLTGDASATAEFTDADLPDTDGMMKAVGGLSNLNAQQDDIKDTGWKSDYSEVPKPLIKRLPNEQLWQLIRRFDMVSSLQSPSEMMTAHSRVAQQMYHVKATDGPFPGGLDLNISDEEEFSPDKLRANFERLYMTVVGTTLNILGISLDVIFVGSYIDCRHSSVC
jgi:hypothetical protein